MHNTNRGRGYIKATTCTKGNGRGLSCAKTAISNAYPLYLNSYSEYSVLHSIKGVTLVGTHKEARTFGEKLGTRHSDTFDFFQIFSNEFKHNLLPPNLGAVDFAERK